MHKLLMVAGPTEVEKEILKIGSKPQEYMRTPYYTKVLQDVFTNLQYIFETKNPVVMFASSGTGAMEAAATNILSKNDLALFINGGTFGKRWGDILAKHDVIGIEKKVEFGKSISPKIIEEELNKNPNIKAVFATLDETSSGAKTDIQSIGKIIKERENTVFVVDCVSGLLVEEMQMDNWGIDVAITSSQKALAIPPGLSFLAISEKALKFSESANLRQFYFDIFEYLKDWKRNQTPFTPPVSLVNQLDQRLKKIKKEGLKNYRLRYQKNTKLIRDGLNKLGFSVFADCPANAVTGVKTEKYDASKIVEIMRNKFNIEIAPSGGERAKTFFRIGNMGNIKPKHIKRMLKSLKKTISILDKTR